MNDILFLVLRRLRLPLIALIVSYAVAVVGLSLMPGVLADGQPGRMSFFHAFYVVSYTATTIGFGEIPYPFSESQRGWMIVVIYMSVIGWTYTLGSIFSLVNDKTFRTALARNLFAWQVRSLGERFFIVCGFGQSARLLAKALDSMGLRVVVIEMDADREARIVIENLGSPAVSLCADARFPDTLRDAGIHHPMCAGLLAMTSEDNANQTIAIGARTLAPNLQVIARAKSHIAQSNIQAFGGIEVINPFDTFAENIGLDLDAPDVLRLEEWLTNSPYAECPGRLGIPQGNWVLVGFGRFGQSIAQELESRGIAWQAIDHQPISSPQGKRLLVDDNTEHSLHEAAIESASVVVAGTDNDSVNLAIATLARRANPSIFVVIRQNHIADAVLIQSAQASMRFVQSDLMVHECLQRIHVPMLRSFLKRIATSGAAQATRCIGEIESALGTQAPFVWTFECDIFHAGMFSAFCQGYGTNFKLFELSQDPHTFGEKLACLPLMLEREDAFYLMPDPNMDLQAGDRILFVGSTAAKRLQQRFLDDASTLDFVRRGVEQPRTWLFRKIKARHAARIKSRA
jgi:Trk K+ transport system NAD-binding subunit